MSARITWKELENAGNINSVRKLAGISIFVHGTDAEPYNGLVHFWHRCLPVLTGTSSIHFPETREPGRWNGESGFIIENTIKEFYSNNTGEKRTAEYNYRLALAEELIRAKGLCLFFTARSAMSPGQKARVIRALDLIFPLVRPGFTGEVRQETLAQYDEDGDFSVSESAVCAACGSELIVTHQDRGRFGHRIQYTYDGWPICYSGCEERLGNTWGDDSGFFPEDAAKKLLALMPAEKASKIAAAKIGEFIQFPGKTVGGDGFAFALSAEIIIIQTGEVRQIYLPHRSRGFLGSPSEYRRLYRRKVSRICANK